MRKDLSDICITREPKDNVTNNDKEKYNRCKTHKEVLRDIVRTVYQMKMLIEKNSINDLGKTKFKYKMGNEELGINEVIIPVAELNKICNIKNSLLFVLLIA